MEAGHDVFKFQSFLNLSLESQAIPDGLACPLGWSEIRDFRNVVTVPKYLATEYLVLNTYLLKSRSTVAVQYAVYMLTTTILQLVVISNN